MHSFALISKPGTDTISTELVAAGTSGSATIEAVCGPIDINFREVFGRDLTAAEFAAASSGPERARCIVQKDDDLHQAIRHMNALGADVLLVMEDSMSTAASAIVGVVTKTDISRNLSNKSALMARDRSLLKVGAKLPVATTNATAAGSQPAPRVERSAMEDSIEIQQFGS